MDKKVYWNPATILTVFDWLDKEGKDFPIEKKINLLQTAVRYLSRKDHTSKEEKERTQEAIRAYRAELEFLKDQQDKISSDLAFDIEPVAIQLAADSVDQKELCKSTLMEYVRHKKKDSDRSDRDIYIKEIDKDGQSNVKESTFYRWIKKYNDVLDAFDNAQEK